MADKPGAINPTTILLTTSVVAFVSGFFLGIYSIRGYLISPSLRAERAANLADPEESEESDIDENDTILDHAPNWSNAFDADRKQGLRATGAEVAAQQGAAKSRKQKNGGSKKAAAEEDFPNEECKLVLVVRTDLGMTKGMIHRFCHLVSPRCFSPMGNPYN